MAEEHKERGNDFFKEGKYSEAIQCYTTAISIDSKVPQYFTNRSLAYYLLKNYQKSIDDAQKAIDIDPSYAKGYLRIGYALSKLGKLRSSRDAFKRATSFSPESVYLDALKDAEKRYIDSYYHPITHKVDVHVKWINHEMGRGVFSDKKIYKGEIVFSEYPLSCFRKVTKGDAHLKSCGYCLRVFLEQNDLGPYFKSQHKKIYPTGFKWVECLGCKESIHKEIYCNESCKTKAWNEYHCLLCTGGWKSELLALFASISEKCLEASIVNPMIILKILCKVIISVQNNSQSIEEGFEPYRTFSPNNEKAELVDELITFLKALCDIKYGSIPSSDRIISRDNIQFLNGVLSRNAVSVRPLSDFHLYISSLPDSYQAIIANIYKKDSNPMDFVHSEWMQGLTIHGTGLFPIGNSINHSCIPNVASASCYNDSRISLVSLRPIESGDELLISYIDEELPFEERKAKLLKYYNFECRCQKCVEKI